MGQALGEKHLLLRPLKTKNGQDMLVRFLLVLIFLFFGCFRFRRFRRLYVHGGQ